MPHIDQTPREYLASLTPPLAKMGRGRLSAAAHAKIDEMTAQGYTFAEPVKVAAKPKPAPAPAPVRQVATTVPVAPKPNSPSALAARLMAGRQQGEAQVKADTPNVKPEALVKRKPVRRETLLHSRSPEGFLVSYSTCMNPDCNQAVQFCECKDGPRPPKDCERVESRSMVMV